MKAIARCMLLVPLFSYFLDPRTSLATAFAPLNSYPQPLLSRRMLQRCIRPRIACISMQRSNRNSGPNRFSDAMEDSSGAEEDHSQRSETTSAGAAGSAYNRRTCAYAYQLSDEEYSHFLQSICIAHFVLKSLPLMECFLCDVYSSV
jgi:hypothetical protein